jgi:hypothetical protein
VILPEGVGRVAQRIYVKDNLNVNFLKTSSAPNKATLNSIIPATIQENPICYLANGKSKNIVLKNLAAIADPSSNSTDTNSFEDSDEGSTVSDTSSNADTDGKAGVTAIIAKLVHNKADSQSSSGLKHQSKSRKSNLIRVLLDSGSDGDLWFQEKGTKSRFPYLTRQVPKSWHTSNGSFLTKGRGEVNLTFFEYSNSKRFMIKPDIVEYDPKKMARPAFDLILGVETLSKLGIVLDFQTKTIAVDESILPM